MTLVDVGGSAVDDIAADLRAALAPDRIVTDLTRLRAVEPGGSGGAHCLKYGFTTRRMSQFRAWSPYLTVAVLLVVTRTVAPVKTFLTEKTDIPINGIGLGANVGTLVLAVLIGVLIAAVWRMSRSEDPDRTRSDADPSAAYPSAADGGVPVGGVPAGAAAPRPRDLPDRPKV